MFDLTFNVSLIGLTSCVSCFSASGQSNIFKHLALETEAYFLTVIHLKIKLLYLIKLSNWFRNPLLRANPWTVAS